MATATDLILPLVIFVLGLWWWYRIQRNKFYRNIPGPPTVPFFGNALDLQSTSLILDSLLGYVKNYGGLVKVEIGPVKRFLLVADYKMLQFVLSNTDKTLLAKSEDYKFLQRWLGTGLLIGDGPKWKKHRKILTPAFHFQILEQFIEIFETCGNVLIRKLAKEVEKDSVDVAPFVTMCALDIICESTMGVSINAQSENESDYVKSVKEMCRIIIERSVSPLQIYEIFYQFSKNYQTEKNAVQILHNKAHAVIESRLQELRDQAEEGPNEGAFSNRRKAFLDLLLSARVDGQPLSQEYIREEVDTFMFAGHDTVTSAINFTLYCLANHPDVQKLVYEEQQAIFADADTPAINYANLQSMKYLELVIKETLRLYPSVPLIGRRTLEELTYENTRIPKGETLLLFIYGIHRDPTYFEDPEKFDPNRFAKLEGRFPYAYIPFSAGPRNCIGQKYAMLEMKSVISKIVRTFELRPSVPAHAVKLVAESVLKSANGVKISLKLRS